MRVETEEMRRVLELEEKRNEVMDKALKICESGVKLYKKALVYEIVKNLSEEEAKQMLDDLKKKYGKEE